jgi:acyl-CoA dehydrogenase
VRQALQQGWKNQRLGIFPQRHLKCATCVLGDEIAALAEIGLQNLQGLADFLNHVSGKGCGHHVRALADEERVLQQIAQPLQGMADGWLSEVELLAGASDVALAVDGFEDYEQVQVDLAQMHAVYITGFVRFIRRILAESLGWMPAVWGHAMDFSLSATAKAYVQRLSAFMEEHVLPAEAEYHAELQNLPDWRGWKQPPIMERLKATAKAAGLWNLFLPDKEYGAGLSNVEYAPLAEITGRSPIAPEVFNCNAPDTGNMEVLVKYGSPQQKTRWLTPLLAGEIRSAFCMTEPDVASSDATNMQATALIEGDEVVLNGLKWWSSGLGHPHCRLLIFMGITNRSASQHQRHSMVLVPLATPGVEIQRMVSVFGSYDPPFGHGEVRFTNVRLPVEYIIAGPGRGFEIAQGRLGPGRIHHCMRTLGAAELALELLCRRSLQRVAFGKPLAELGANGDVIADARIMLEQGRLLTLKAAWMLDEFGVKGARSEISQIKVSVPNIALEIIDRAIQMHGGAGVSADVPLADMFAKIRTLRIADGPDEVHRALIARLELGKYRA